MKNIWYELWAHLMSNNNAVNAALVQILRHASRKNWIKEEEKRASLCGHLLFLFCYVMQSLCIYLYICLFIHSFSLYFLIKSNIKLDMFIKSLANFSFIFRELLTCFTSSSTGTAWPFFRKVQYTYDATFTTKMFTCKVPWFFCLNQCSLHIYQRDCQI